MTEVAGLPKARLSRMLYVALASALLVALAGWIGYGIGTRCVGHDTGGDAEKPA